MQIKNAVYIKIGCKSTISNSQKLGVDSKKCKKNAFFCIKRTLERELSNFFCQLEDSNYCTNHRTISLSATDIV